MTFRKLIVLALAFILALQVVGGSAQYELKAIKKASTNDVSPGGYINYTIYCKNKGSEVLSGISIKELYPQNIRLISAFPHPDADTNDQWTVGTLSPGATKIIKVNCRHYQKEINFHSQGRIEGRGFLRVNNHISNSFQSRTVLNQVIVTSDQTDPLIATSLVKVSQEKNELEIKKSGSCIYIGQEELNSRNDLFYGGSHTTTFEPYPTDSNSLHLAANKSIGVTSRWNEEISAQNRAVGTSISEEYRYTTAIDKFWELRLDQNSTDWETNSEFTGKGHIGVLKKSELSSSSDGPPSTLESLKDFMGSFKINQNLKDRNTKISKIDISSLPSYVLTPQVRLIASKPARVHARLDYTSSAAGIGSVFGFDKVGNSPLSSELGTGVYKSSTKIRPQDNYLVKNQSLLYKPSSFMTTESGEWCNQSLKWNSKISSGNNKDRFMGMRISSADRLNEMVKIKGLNFMEVEANFSGRANLVTIFKDMGYRQEYLGNYSVEQRISQKGVVNYNQPHLTLFTEGRLSYSPNRTLAQYAIEMVNDGNCCLDQIELVDIFPKDAEFVSSSQKFSELTSSEAKWTVDPLKMGQVCSIELILDVTKNDGDLENKVVASCENSGLQVINTTLLTPNVVRWPSKCCMIKNAWLNSEDKNVIWYSILVSNTANFSQKALLKDLLPLQTAFVNSSVDPQTIDGRKITWSFQLLPYENWTATYRVEASEEGTRINYAQVELHPPDGSPISVAYAEAEVKVGSGDRYSGEKWRPPDWGLELDMDNCCNLTRNSYLESGCN